ncbi:MAG: hypothetical protein Q4G25_12715 [Paracoccus sp. (in: a-proteobacteria)]|nr:hypothetical protein [Paracoccus sp. (in: a-proteobacteria)]
MTALNTETLFAQTIRRRLSRSILIKDSAAFARLQTELQQALTRAWDDAMREGIINALDRLRDLGPGSFTQADATSILSALEERVGREAIQAAMRKPVINLTDAIFRVGAAEVGAAAGIDIAFARPDLDALDALKHNNMVWIGQTWDSHTKKKLDAALTEFFRDGMTRDGLAQRMADDFRTLTSRSHVYWEMFADHTATKVREIGRVTGYERAGMEYVQIRAHLDERTTPVCRHLHGRVIAVSTLSDQRDTYLEAGRRGDIETMKRAWVMHGSGADLSATATRDLEGVGSPPYHYRCRTITVAYWPPAPSAQISIGEMGRRDVALHDVERKTYDRVALTRKEVAAMIDRARTAGWANHDKMRATFEKHRDALRVKELSGFSQSAVDLIRRGNRDLYLTMHTKRDGSQELRMIFEGVAKTSKGGAALAKTIVAVESNRIISHHRTGLKKSEAFRGGVKQPARGIMKWLMF